jgi:hypothetical protein
VSAFIDYGLDSPARALLILALSMQDRAQKKEMDRLHIQKTIKYFEHLQQEEKIDFSNFKYGGVSYELHENLETLEECGLIDSVGTAKNPKYVLTEEGDNVAKELLATYGKEELRKLNFAKLQLNDLSYEEMLFFMYMLIPETQKHSVEFARLNKKRRTLVRKLFRKGRINSTTAAKWLGVDEKIFLNSL